MQRFIATHTSLTTGILVVAALIIAYGGYSYYTLSTRLSATEQQLASTTAEMSSTISNLEQDRSLLTEVLRLEQERNLEFQEQIEQITNTVGDLDKLSRTDPELLQKYSRVFFLNEHYRPQDLTEIPQRYRTPEDDDEFIHTQVWPHLKDLLDEATKDGINLRIISAFRTFDEQSNLKSQYDVTYGAGTANQFSAAQGYSEHQLGTTVDFTTQELGAAFSNLAQTEAYQWLLDNAHEYGFVLSYPEDNAYYQFEPWHWRFVGTSLARTLDRENEHFYDLNQREIDTYLIELFD
jgi:D-alanyl-D-alanine carboxypeptidase